MITLNPEQIQFLNFLINKHRGIGWGSRISRILNKKEYTADDSNSHHCIGVDVILQDWRDMCNGIGKADIILYGVPKKYLKCR